MVTRKSRRRRCANPECPKQVRHSRRTRKDVFDEVQNGDFPPAPAGRRPARGGRSGSSGRSGSGRGSGKLPRRNSNARLPFSQAENALPTPKSVRERKPDRRKPNRASPPQPACRAMAAMVGYTRSAAAPTTVQLGRVADVWGGGDAPATGPAVAVEAVSLVTSMRDRGKREYIYILGLLINSHNTPCPMGCRPCP